MTYKPTQLPTVVPKDAPNNRAVLALNFVADMLSGAKNMKALDRAVRVGELMDTGLFDLNEAGLLVPKSEGGGVGQVFTGRNRLINGNFRVWQRGTGFNNNGYSADRWLVQHAGASFNVFPASLYGEGLSSGAAMGIAVTSLGTGLNIRHPIENVNTLAGKQCVISFRARGNFSDMLMSVRAIQSYGTGGSASTSGTTKQVKLDTAMRTYSVLMTLPSVAGKTIGANNFLAVVFDLQSTGTYYISDFQIEEGDVATPFEWRSEAQELLLCQRYYEKSYASNVYAGTASGFGRECNFYDRNVGGNGFAQARFKVTKRTTPNIAVYNDQTGAQNQISSVNGVAGTVTAISVVADTGFQVTYQSASGQWGAGFHWTAESEF